VTINEGTKLGRYEIRSQLGAGGMGEVYLARDTKLDRKAALKILPAEVAADRNRMERFVQEAKAASALNHPNILTIHEIGSSPTVREGSSTSAETHFIATEFIDGETLRQRMQSMSIKLGEALDVAIQTASALEAAHAEGIIHRDIKPENVMVRRDGIVNLGAACAQAGERGTAQKILKRLQTSGEYVSPGELPVLYAALGEREKAFASLEKAYSAHDQQLQYLGVEPAFDSLRSDARFKDLLRRIGLPQ
jgi:serine/threonine protein kinase